MTSLLKVSPLLTLLFSLLFLGQASAAAASSNSTQACSELISSLGDKVINSTSDPKEYYYSRTHYYSARNENNHPTCVLLAESTQDVSTAMKVVRKFSSRFAVKAGELMVVSANGRA